MELQVINSSFDAGPLLYPIQGMIECEIPFPKVGYVSSLEGNYPHNVQIGNFAASYLPNIMTL